MHPAWDVDARKHVELPQNGGGFVLGYTSDCHRVSVSLLRDLNPPRVTLSSPPWLRHICRSDGVCLTSSLSCLTGSLMAL